MGNEYKLSFTAEEIDERLRKVVDLDPTLTKSGAAADAKAVGDALAKINGGEENKSSNLYNPAAYSANDFLDNSTFLSSGAIRTEGHSSDWNYIISPYFEVSPNTEYTVGKYNGTSWLNPWGDIATINAGRCFDANKKVLNATTGISFVKNDNNTYTFVTPSTAKYVRLVMYKGGKVSKEEGIALFNRTFMLSLEVPTEFELYETSTGNITLDMLSDDARKKLGQALYGKTVVNFGDSIFGNARPPQDISTMLADITGATVKNCAFGGCRMAVHTGHWDAFSMYRLAHAIANNDYSLQDEAINYDDRTSYAEEPLALIKETDFSKVDIVTIAYGANDWGGSNPLDNAENLYDTTTMCGALRYSVETLLTAFPQLRIFVLLPTYRFWMDADGAFTEDSETRTNNLGKTTGEYCQAIRAVAELYNLPVIDNYKQLCINKFNRTQYFPANDGSHHNENGRKVIATHIAKNLW